MSQLSTTPASIQQASTETLSWPVDMTQYLGTGEAVSSPSATLTRLSDGTAYTGGVGSVTAASSVVTVPLTALEAGQRYRLVVTFTAAAGKVKSTETLVWCPF